MRNKESSFLDKLLIPHGGKHNNASPPQQQWKARKSKAGLHLFDRNSGMNILFDEVSIPESQWARAPRQLSIALTNRCDLKCAHCYAPKSRDELCFDTITEWLSEIDSNGTLGVGFGGGEPTLYRRFTELCQHTARETNLSVTFTTHGHHINSVMADELRGSVHFIRVSMDGVRDTYESIRRRSFRNFLDRLKNIETVSPFGINIVVNDRTVRELSEAAEIAVGSGASELLLLPQIAVANLPAISPRAMEELRGWVEKYNGPLKLNINALHAEGFHACDPFADETSLDSYAHIDATRIIKRSSYDATGVPVGVGGVMVALKKLVQSLGENSL